jgi:uncharacterized protein YbjT (DUF2867 family)
MKIAVAGATGAVGHHVVDVARERGHDVVPLSRSSGVDLTVGDGLAEALEDVDVVIDVSSTSTQSGTRSRRFFGTVTSNLLTAERAAGVNHHIALSIVGSNSAPFGYYAGKALQEELVSAGRVPWTILRATQFHEFAEQIYGQIALGPVHLVPKMISQPVAAREVAERLVDLAQRPAAGRSRDLAGPQVLRMAALVRHYAKALHRGGTIIEVPLPGGFGKALRDGSLTAEPGAELGRQTFDSWLRERAQSRN